MKLISKLNKGIRFSLYVFSFGKYTWVIPLEDIKGITISNTFQTNLKESNRKPNKMCVDKGSEFNNILMKSWLEKKCNENVFNT